MSATVTKLRPAQPSIQEQAKTALSICKRMQKLNEQLEPYKLNFIVAAGGDTLPIIVPGKGRITVSKASPPSTSTYITVDEAKLEALDEETRNRFWNSGVLVNAVKQNSGRKASVTFKTND